MSRTNRLVLLALAAIAATVLSVGIARFVARRGVAQLHSARGRETSSALLIMAISRAPVWRRESPGADVARILRDRGVTTVLIRVPDSRAPIGVRAESLVVAIDPALRSMASSVPAASWPRRVVLAGHGAAAGIIARLALEPRLLVRAGLDSLGVDGVIALSGRFDSDSSAPGPSVVGRTAFLIATGADDTEEAARQGRRFARFLEQEGFAPVAFRMIADRDDDSIADFSRTDDVTNAFAAFIRGDPAASHLDPRWTSRLRDAATRSTRAFASDPSLVKQYPMSPRLRQILLTVLGGARFELNAYDLRTYEAVDLLDYLATRPSKETGDGDYLVVSNERGERLYLSRADIVRLRPQIVIGLDDESDLFRLFVAYRPRLSYSWVKDTAQPPWMTRPVGGVFLFPGRFPPHFPFLTSALSGLTPESFQWQRHDPLGKLRGLPDSLQTALMGASGCVHCHSLRGQGASSHHARLDDPRAGPGGGGVALPLEQYPPQVLQAFLFDQEPVATMFGVMPLVLSRVVASQLDSLVRAERARR